MRRKFFFFMVFSCLCRCLQAQLQLAPIFSDNMVLQRGKPIVIFGKSFSGDTITVSFFNKKRKVVVMPEGTWKVTFAKQKENNIVQNIVVSNNTQKIILKNILIGDVWVCIGQSNMEWPMYKEMHYNEEKNQATIPTLRFYNPSYVGKNIYGKPYADSLIKLLTAENFYSKPTWQQCDSSSIKEMSAVGYYFGKSILQQTAVPIGLINLSIGGAPLETFINPQKLKCSQQFSAKVAGNWLQNNSLPIWIRERGLQNVGTIKNVPSDELGSNHAYKPGFAYCSGIKPILDLPIKGIICYQGESNAQELERVKEYRTLTNLMITDFRQSWGDTALPFYFVQLSSIDTTNYKSQYWPAFRDEQRKLLQIPHTGMAVCSDIGLKNDVHPPNKKDVGERLARWALRFTYNKNIIPSGPLPHSVKYKNGITTIQFKFVGEKLMTLDNHVLRGFSIDGSLPVHAVINKKTVQITTPVKPSYIFYGWQPFSQGNLINFSLLPASTFMIMVK